MIKLRLTGRQHRELFDHLFPGDGLEAVAFALCGRAKREGAEVLSARHIFTVPHEICARKSGSITWPGNFLAAHLNLAYRDNLAIVKIHSHPGDYAKFSEVDDLSDGSVHSSITSWLSNDDLHLSAIMLSDGRMLARSMDLQNHEPV